MRFGAASLYHEDMYDPAVPVGSLWEETAEPFEGGAPFEGPQSCDTAIIGGGYTGLSAAYHLAKDYGVDVCLLEAGPLGWGASGRNGGFCAPYPSSLGLETLLSRYGAEEACRFMKTQEEAIEKLGDKAKVKVGKFPMMANSRAKTNHEPDGFVKVIADAETDRVLGVWAIASVAGTMIAQAAQAMEFGATSEDIAYTCHAHPTHSEAIKEAAMAVTGKPIHM